MNPRRFACLLVASLPLLLAACNSPSEPEAEGYSHDPKQSWAWVHDACGDSLQVNYWASPIDPEDEDGWFFDSISIPGVRIRHYENRSDTLPGLVAVGVWLYGAGATARWILDFREDYFYGSATGRDYDEEIYDFGCYVYESPRILVQPADLTVAEGDDAVLTIQATDGTKPRAPGFGWDHNVYTWYKNGSQVYVDNGGDNFGSDKGSVLTLPVTLADQKAKIHVVVSNGYRRVTSREALLTIVPD
jgi:hypothetical protein